VVEALPTYLKAFHNIERGCLTLHVDTWHVSLGAFIKQGDFMMCHDHIHPLAHNSTHFYPYFFIGGCH
jgi:hypothetical protein